MVDKHSKWKARMRVCLFAAAVLAASSVEAEETAAPQTPMPPAAQSQSPLPSAEQVVVLIRSTLLTLNDALHTGNFTVLRDRGAPSFQAANTAARLSQIFKSLGRQGVDLSIVAAKAPQLTEGPALDANQRLHIAGNFPAQPVAINFGLIFEESAGGWRLFGITVNPEPVQAAEARMPRFAPRWDVAGTPN
jgi:hypothetical protein